MYVHYLSISLCYEYQFSSRFLVLFVFCFLDSCLDGRENYLVETQNYERTRSAGEGLLKTPSSQCSKCGVGLCFTCITFNFILNKKKMNTVHSYSCLY